MTVPAPGTDARAPVLLPAPVRGELAARQRVLLRPDGALVHVSAGGERLLLEPGGLRDAHLLRAGGRVGRTKVPDDRGDWVLIVGGGRSVALCVDGWTPGLPGMATDPLARSGIRALLGALGVAGASTFDLDERDPALFGQIPDPVLLDPRRGRPWRLRRLTALEAWRAVLVLLLVLWVGESLTDPLGGESRGDYPSSVLAVLAVLLALPLATVLLAPLVPRRRRAATPVASTGPARWGGPGGRPSIGVTDDGALLVVDRQGTATVVPGPLMGGAARVMVLAGDGVRPTTTALTTASGETLLLLPATWWPSDEDAARALDVLREAGLAVSRQRVPPQAVRPLPRRRERSPDTEEIAWSTAFIALPMLIPAVTNTASVATGILLLTVALSVAVVRQERRRR